MGELERAREEYEQATWTLQHKVTDTVLGTNALNAADALITALEAALAAVERERDRWEWKLTRLCDEGVITDEDLATLELVYVEFHRDCRPLRRRPPRTGRGG